LIPTRRAYPTREKSSPRKKYLLRFPTHSRDDDHYFNEIQPFCLWVWNTQNGTPLEFEKEPGVPSIPFCPAEFP
jgi:hypothetical protein